MKMTPLEIFTVMRRAGFPAETATAMTAIALRESGGDPRAFNDTLKTRDRSYGLLQINMFGRLARVRLKAFGLAQEQQLFNPDVNAHAGFVIWGGDDANLDVAWYVKRGIYKQRYEQHLPAAQSAAAEYLGAHAQS